MRELAADVNLIVARVNVADNMHVSVLSWITLNRRRYSFVLLDKVKSSFIYTVARRFKSCGLVIERVVLQYRARQRKTILRKFDPLHTLRLMNIDIDTGLENIAKTEGISYGSLKSFENTMLSKGFTLITLLEDEQKFSEFREKYLTRAEEEADQQINIFKNQFSKISLINKGDVPSYDTLLAEMYKSPADLFENHKDCEDIKIAAEYFAIQRDIGNCEFVTCDRELYRSLQWFATSPNYTCGELHLITKNKSIAESTR